MGNEFIPLFESLGQLSERRRLGTLELLAALTGTELLNPDRVAGRWVWGRPSTPGRPGAVHVEILPTDPIANTLSMALTSSEDMRLSRQERWKLYKQRRVQESRRLNEEVVAAGGLVQLLKKSGEGTRQFERMCRELADELRVRGNVNSDS